MRRKLGGARYCSVPIRLRSMQGLNPKLLPQVSGRMFSSPRLLVIGVQTSFWAELISPMFLRHFLSQDELGGRPATLSLLARLSLFEVGFERSASCDRGQHQIGKAIKTHDTLVKKERLADRNQRAFFALSRVVSPAKVEAATRTRNGARNCGSGKRYRIDA